MPAIAEDRFLCGFGHALFAGGYSAGSTTPTSGPRCSPLKPSGRLRRLGWRTTTLVKTEGTKFANTVLSLGGGVAPLEVFKSFRGGNPPSRRSSRTRASSRRPRKDGDARRSRETRKGETRDGRGSRSRDIGRETNGIVDADARVRAGDGHVASSRCYSYFTPTASAARRGSRSAAAWRVDRRHRRDLIDDVFDRWNPWRNASSRPSWRRSGCVPSVGPARPHRPARLRSPRAGCDTQRLHRRDRRARRRGPP